MLMNTGSRLRFSNNAKSSPYETRGVFELLKYRKLLDLTDEEVRFVLTDIFEAKKVEDIKRDDEWNTITARITTGG